MGRYSVKRERNKARKREDRKKEIGMNERANRAFHNFGASKSVDWRSLFSSETSIGGLF